VVSFDPKTNVLLFPIAGDLLVAKGIGGMIHGASMKYISKDFLSTKDIDTNNAEEVIRMQPDIIVLGINLAANISIERYDLFSGKINIPVVVVDLDLKQLDKSIDFLGELLNRTDDARLCSRFVRSIYALSDECKEKAPAPGSVYLANRSTGLLSASENTTHTQVFTYMNIPVVTKGDLDPRGFTPVSIEQVMVWNPDYIFCLGSGESNPYRNILKSGVWRRIKAVGEQRVYNVPATPYPWIDMPPSVNRLPGIIWLAYLFYGLPAERTEKEIREFYRIFYRYELSEKEYKDLFKWH
jgi:iron complex transport system substrate-binding protein